MARLKCNRFPTTDGGVCSSVCIINYSIFSSTTTTTFIDIIIIPLQLNTAKDLTVDAFVDSVTAICYNSLPCAIRVNA